MGALRLGVSAVVGGGVGGWPCCAGSLWAAAAAEAAVVGW